MAEAATAPTGTLDTALAHTRRLLGRDAALAEQQCREIIRVVPGSAEAHALLGRALSLKDRGDDAIDALRRAVWLDRDLAEGWRLLSAQLRHAGDAAGAERAHAEEMRASAADPQLRRAAVALVENDLPTAEHLLRVHLAARGDDPAALRMLAEVGGRLGAYDDALAMLDHALALAPDFAAARFNRAIVLSRLNRQDEALTELDWLLDRDPADPSYRNLRGAVLSGIGDLDGAIGHFEAALARRPAQPRVWLNYGHSLKTVGRQEDGVAAYRRALALEPKLGEAWWSLANLKTVHFTDADIAAMSGMVEREGLWDDDRLQLHFALGKALEDAGEDESAFRNYAAGNRLRHAQLGHDPDVLSKRVATARNVLTEEFFAARAGWGDPTPDPIFVLGMPRAGSTLIEQILASHPLVEGTQELPDIQRLARREAAADGGDYPATLADLSPERAAALGAEYLERTRLHRRTDRPFFIDKMPNNWLHVPFIRLILPNATIIDARRHPLACCFSNFKQHFARGQTFSYSLESLGRYYRDYVALMDHVDAVLPGHVHRVLHEAVVTDTESEVRRLLDFLGLPFDEACLRFHETERAVRTASSEQVRRPIFREGLDQWRRFDPWLGPLRNSLGDTLDGYPIAT